MIDATRLATALLGDAIAANLFLLGFAWQKGLLPLTREGLTTAITLNGTAVAANLAAFAWGRQAAVDPEGVARAAGVSLSEPVPVTLDDLIAGRAKHLREYQGRRLARRYTRLVERVRTAEQAMFSGGTVLTEAVARGLHRVLAIKDEYEVARLYASPAFRESLAAQFSETPKLTFHLAPPLLARVDPANGHAQKRAFGPWIMTAFRLLAPMRVLRGTWLDPFAHTEERRAERRLIGEYEEAVAKIIRLLSPQNLKTSVELALLPEQIRGFGHVKMENLRNAKVRWTTLLQQLDELGSQKQGM